jgi:hypothetical protein
MHGTLSRDPVLGIMELHYSRIQKLLIATKTVAYCKMYSGHVVDAKVN